MICPENVNRATIKALVRTMIWLLSYLAGMDLITAKGKEDAIKELNDAEDFDNKQARRNRDLFGPR